MAIHSLAGVPLMRSCSLRLAATVIIAAHNSEAWWPGGVGREVEEAWRQACRAMSRDYEALSIYFHASVANSVGPCCAIRNDPVVGRYGCCSWQQLRLHTGRRNFCGHRNQTSKWLHVREITPDKRSVWYHAWYLHCSATLEPLEQSTIGTATLLHKYVINPLHSLATIGKLRRWYFYVSSGNSRFANAAIYVIATSNADFAISECKFHRLTIHCLRMILNDFNYCVSNVIVF